MENNVMVKFPCIKQEIPFLEMSFEKEFLSTPADDQNCAKNQDAQNKIPLNDKLEPNDGSDKRSSENSTAGRIDDLKENQAAVKETDGVQSIAKTDTECASKKSDGDGKSDAGSHASSTAISSATPASKGRRSSAKKRPRSKFEEKNVDDSSSSVSNDPLIKKRRATGQIRRTSSNSPLKKIPPIKLRTRSSTRQSLSQIKSTLSSMFTDRQESAVYDSNNSLIGSIHAKCDGAKVNFDHSLERTAESRSSTSNKRKKSNAVDNNMNNSISSVFDDQSAASSLDPGAIKQNLNLSTGAIDVKTRSSSRKVPKSTLANKTIHDSTILSAFDNPLETSIETSADSGAPIGNPTAGEKRTYEYIGKSCSNCKKIYDNSTENSKICESCGSFLTHLCLICKEHSCNSKPGVYKHIKSKHFGAEIKSSESNNLKPDLKLLSVHNCLKCNNSCKIIEERVLNCQNCLSVMAFRCIICGFFTETLAGIHDHLFENHKEHYANQTEEKTKVSNDENQNERNKSIDYKTPNKQLIAEGKVQEGTKCSKCSIFFSSPKTLSAHSNDCSGIEKLMQCKLCPYQSTDEKTFQSHVSTNHSAVKARQSKAKIVGAGSVRTPRKKKNAKLNRSVVVNDSSLGEEAVLDSSKNQIEDKIHERSTIADPSKEKSEEIADNAASMSTTIDEEIDNIDEAVKEFGSEDGRSCLKCSKTFFSKDKNLRLKKLSIHLMYCGKPADLSCSLCLYKTANPTGLKLHIFHKHGLKPPADSIKIDKDFEKVNDGVLPAVESTSAFEQSSMLEDADLTEEDNGPFSDELISSPAIAKEDPCKLFNRATYKESFCSKCGKTFDDPTEHSKSCKRRSEPAQRRSIKSRVESDSRRNLRSRKSFCELPEETIKRRCPNCGDLHAKLEEHLKKCNKENMIDCPFCSYRAKHKDDLKIHLVIHLSKNLKFAVDNKQQEEHDKESKVPDIDSFVEIYCPKCKDYKSKIFLQYDPGCENCSSQLIYRCLKCKAEHNNKKSINQHVKQHIETYILSCSTCDKHFSKIENLKMHQKVCVKEPVFQCQLCVYKTKFKPYITRHISLSHSDV